MMRCEKGFTLLEIMLVLAIMAMLTALLLPRMFRPTEAPLQDSARHLLHILNLAAEEAAVRGVPLRWRGYPHRYDFAIAKRTGEWHPLSEPPFAPETLPAGVVIAAVQQDNSMLRQDAVDAGKEDRLLGTIVFAPDGLMTVSNIILQAAAGEVRIQIRPGPSGIRLRSQQP